jgi:hypothetical protein
MQTFYERSDIDERLQAACDKMGEVIADHYKPDKPSIDTDNLIASFLMGARSTMLLSFADIAGEDGRKLCNQRIKDIVRLAPIR